MKQILLLLLLVGASLPSCGQQKNIFHSIAETIVPHETTTKQIEQKFGLVAIDTVVGPRNLKEYYFKDIGIGFLLPEFFKTNILVVHLKETNQQSDEYFFRKNLSVDVVVQRLGMPAECTYDPETGLVSFGTGTRAYHLHDVKLPEETFDRSLPFYVPIPFEPVYYIIKDLEIDLFLIDFSKGTPSLH